MAVAHDYIGGQPAPRTGWSGWLVFAAVMLGLAGIFQGIAGFTALFNDSYYVVPTSDLVVKVDYTVWGWVHMGIGVLLLLASVSLATSGTFGRVLGILVAVLSAVSNIVFIAANPVWSVVVIAVDVLVIFAIAVHGRELAE